MLNQTEDFAVQGWPTTKGQVTSLADKKILVLQDMLEYQSKQAEEPMIASQISSNPFQVDGMNRQDCFVYLLLL